MVSKESVTTWRIVRFRSCITAMYVVGGGRICVLGTRSTWAKYGREVPSIGEISWYYGRGRDNSSYTLRFIQRATLNPTFLGYIFISIYSTFPRPRPSPPQNTPLIAKQPKATKRRFIKASRPTLPRRSPHKRRTAIPRQLINHRKVQLLLRQQCPSGELDRQIK